MSFAFYFDASLFQTDTASVLLEAIGYIRFLHGQIEVQFSLSLSLSRSLYHVKQKEVVRERARS